MYRPIGRLSKPASLPNRLVACQPKGGLTLPDPLTLQWAVRGSQKGNYMAEVRVGDTAPDFELPCSTGEEKGTFKLSSLRGQKNVVLAFYALDWTST